MSLLSIKNLTLSIGEADILHDVDVEMAQGEVAAITGESGSGKSMTALSIMGLLPHGSRTTGEVAVDGTDILQTSEPDLCDMRGDVMGMVFQEPMTALNPVQTIGAQVAETILIHEKVSTSDAHKRAAQMLQKVGLDMSPNRYPHELSGGQRQRVVIAMAIALRPKLLIADEPTTALDVTTQATILTLLRDLVREFGMGLLIITHDLAVVADIADQIIVMQKGCVVEAAPTAQLLVHMQHPYTRALFAASRHAPPMPEPFETDRDKTSGKLVVENVVRTYDLPRKTLFGSRPQFRALDGVSFSIAPGERVGLVGESGCGKSTLTRAILGLENVQGGRITLDGDPVFSNRAPNLDVRRKMQVVFQDPYGSFNPRHKVARLVSEPWHLLATPPTDGPARIAQALEDVGLSATDADKYIHEFSGGQRQRIAIARALIVDPKLIIFDEAVSALDVSVRAQVLDLISDICARKSLSYLFISHDLTVVRSVTERILVMQDGKIVEQGETETVFTAPRHPYTKTLLAAAPQLPDLQEA